MSSLQEINWQYYIGDTREFWNGPVLPKDHPLYKKVEAEIDRLFHPYNICAEIVDQYVGALIGKPFSWSLKKSSKEQVASSKLRTPTAPSQGSTLDQPAKERSSGADAAPKELATRYLLPATSLDDDQQKAQAEKIIAEWLEWQTEVAVDTDLGDPIANAITQMLVRDQGDGAGVGYLRLYAPDIYSELEPYQKVVFHAPTPGTVEAERNKQGILYKVEYTYGDNEKEIYELLPNGNTLVTNEKTGESVEADYGGRLPIVELKGRAIINDSIKKGQNSINKTFTIKDINTETAGYLERIILNGLPPGKYKEDAEGNKTYVIDTTELNMGPGQITWIAGKPIGDSDNPTDYTDPQVIYRNPVPVETFRDSIELDVAIIYFQVGLAYLLSSGDGKISGKSRLTLKEDFLIRLRVYERIIEGAIRKLLTIVIKILKEDYPILEGYKPVVELNLAVSPLPEERQQNREDVKTGIMSIPTAISFTGVDAQKEINLIEQYLPILEKLSNLGQSDTNAKDRVEDRVRESSK
ncbi:MAG: hypothetical protein ACRC2S_28605 [Waterburya sp.]